MRERSWPEAIVVYATFLALSLSAHVVLILGNRPLRAAAPAAAPAAVPGAAPTAPVVTLSDVERTL